MLVDCRMRQQQPAAAIEAATKGIEAHPSSVPLLLAVSRILLRDPRHSASAREPLARAAKLAPKDAEVHYYYSQWACLHNQEEICIREAEAALSLSPENDAAKLQLNTLIGVAADKLNRPDQASAAFRRSLESNRKLGLPDPAAAQRYIDFLLKRAREEDARVLLDSLIEAAPSFGPAVLERAKFLAKEGNSEQAIVLAERSLTMGGMDRERIRAAHLLLARTYFLLDREQKAMEHQAWIERNPN
jgi:Tfp pilus assembly protein PilF